MLRGVSILCMTKRQFKSFIHSGDFEPENHRIIGSAGNLDPGHGKGPDLGSLEFFGGSRKCKPVSGFPGGPFNERIKISARISEIKNGPAENPLKLVF